MINSNYANNMNNLTCSNNNMILFDIVKQLRDVVNDLSGKKYLENQIKQLKNIIIILNNLINESKKYKNEILKSITVLHDDMKSNFNKISTNYNFQKKTYENGEYFGELRNGLRHGKGTFTNKNGNIFKGQWEDDKPNGYGEEEESDFYKSEGLYKNGKLFGYVNYHFTDGDSMVLFIKDEIKENFTGKGIIYYEKLGGRYEGDIKKGNKHGEGTFYWSEGDKDFGKFFDDKPIGKHVKIKKDGEVNVTDYGGEKISVIPVIESPSDAWLFDRLGKALDNYMKKNP